MCHAFFHKTTFSRRIPFYVIFDNDSSIGLHKKTNNHIKSNIHRARETGLIVSSTVHYPFLEKEWGLPISESGKVDALYEILKQDTESWTEKMRKKYENLRKDLYKFAWCAYLGIHQHS